MSRKSSRDERHHGGSRAATGGADSQEFFSPEQSRRPHRKTLQLCSQIQRTLDYVLSGEMDDDVLRGLMVQQVRPAPDASRLLVTVMPLDEGVSTEIILRRLAMASGRLRAEIARSINRRKTPQLSFEVFVPERKSDAGSGSPLEKPD
jgi:ribosome-binding factor A